MSSTRWEASKYGIIVGAVCSFVAGIAVTYPDLFSTTQTFQSYDVVEPNYTVPKRAQLMCDWGSIPGIWVDGLYWSPLYEPEGCSYVQFRAEDGWDTIASPQDAAVLAEVFHNRSVLIIGSSIERRVFGRLCMDFNISPDFVDDNEYHGQACKLGGFVAGFAWGYGTGDEPYVMYANYIDRDSTKGHFPGLHNGSVDHIKYDLVHNKIPLGGRDPDAIFIGGGIWSGYQLRRYEIWSNKSRWLQTNREFLQGWMANHQALRETFPNSIIVWITGPKNPNEGMVWMMYDWNQLLRAAARIQGVPILDEEALYRGINPYSEIMEKNDCHPGPRGERVVMNMMLNILADIVGIRFMSREEWTDRGYMSTVLGSPDE